MNRTTASIGAALLACLAAPASAATSVTADFTIRNGSVSASGGSVTFTLNPDGTIAASLTAVGGINGFGFDSGKPAVALSNYSSPLPYNTLGWGSIYGVFRSGYGCLGCGTTQTWTIGTAGQFTSVLDALKGGESNYDFVLFDSNNGEWTAPAIVPASAVPEPGTWLLLTTGLGLVAGALRRRPAVRYCFAPRPA